MSMFPTTSLTLLHKLAVEVTGGNEAAWVRFFDLYTPAIRRFVEWNDHVHDPDDVVQEVYLKLVEIIRAGKCNPDKARFRTFLALLIRRQLITLYLQDQTRHVADRCSIDDLADELAAPTEPYDQIDLSMLGNVWEWMSGHQVSQKLDDSVGCRHDGSFCDVAADCSVYKGYHTGRSYRRENCGLRLAARVRPSAAERTDDAANQ